MFSALYSKEGSSLRNPMLDHLLMQTGFGMLGFSGLFLVLANSAYNKVPVLQTTAVVCFTPGATLAYGVMFTPYWNFLTWVVALMYLFFGAWGLQISQTVMDDMVMHTQR
mmetsp:Transcript_33858/g.65902  ORF Transcript_33858/g.65902 Transcript_33858/m.65902 type:complete len:110 (+) Transcript_33858:381-710(+)